jgi:pimeloyl-ACP methyl ester carboxylesterase
LLVICLTIYHHYKLRKEKELIVPVGKLIEINKNNMHVYAEGEKSNKPTLIIMPMSAIPVPVYDYKILYSKLSDEYRVVVVEKAGYGYSEISGGSRNVETMVYETRAALEAAGENGPYVLLPASYSGIEALYWTQTYPNEIAAIIGLDMGVPEAYFAMNLISAVSTCKILNKLAFIGSFRISFEVSRYYDLSKEETKQYVYLANAKMFNKDMIQEGKYALDNAKKVNEKEMPQVPLLLFTTDESTGIDGWRKMQYSFAGKFENSMVIELDCEHEVHCYESDYIAEKTKEFLKQIYTIRIS